MSQFRLPDLGEGLEEAQVVQWLVRVGDRVQLNQPICQVETAKALVDIPSPFAGTVQHLHAKPGDSVAVGAALITIAEVGAPAGTTASQPDGHGPVLVGYGTDAPRTAFSRRPRGVAGAVANAAHTAHDTDPRLDAPTPALSGVDVDHASPLVRKIAAERGIDLRTIAGTGPGGRIRAEDLEASPPVSRPAAAPQAPTLPAAASDEERISTIGLRKAIAARMVRAATTIPHFTEYTLFDAAALVALRDRLKGDRAYAENKLTFLPFFVRALVEAAKAYPILNSRWDEEGNAIVVMRSISVGIATDTARGLLVPVVRDAHRLSLAQSGRRAGTQQDRAFTEHQRRILDENGIGEVFQRRQHIDREAGRAQRRDIGCVFSCDAVIGRRPARVVAQAVDHAAPRRAHNRMGEIEDAHWALQEPKTGRCISLNGSLPCFASERQAGRSGTSIRIALRARVRT